MRMSKTKTLGSVRVVAPSDSDMYITDKDAEMDIRAKQAVKAALHKAKICKKPIAKYDLKNKRVYLQYHDGRQVDVR